MPNFSKKLIDEKQEELRLNAIRLINKIENLTESTKRCITDSKLFPIYLSDLNENVRLLSFLAVKHAGLEELKYQLNRRK